MRIRYKSIAYAYPTSSMAKALGAYADGCWFVEVRGWHNEANEWRTWTPVGAEGFDRATHPDLIGFFRETAGEPDPIFINHGNRDAVAMIAGGFH